MSENKNKGDQKGPQGSGKKPNKNPKGKFNFYWIYAIIGIVLIALNLFSFSGGNVEINYSDFKDMVEKGYVQKVVIQDGERVAVTLNQAGLDAKSNELEDKSLINSVDKNGPHYYFITPYGKDSFSDYMERIAEEKNVEVRRAQSNEWGAQLLQWIIFIGIMIAIWVLIMRRLGGGGGGGGQLFNIGKSKAQLFEKGKGTDVNFKDVAGLEGAKEEVQEIVDFLKNPKKYTDLGAKIPKGALLVGPPGTGKTLLAKAVAGEAQVPFFSLSGSDFVEMFVGVGASRVRDLFRQAKEKAPSIVFIDEIDAIGRARGKNVNMGSNDERENTLNQLLTEMDGFGTNSGVIILAATNRADILDKALMRAGRFDRQIYVDMPDLNERKEIFHVHLKPIKVDESIDIEFLAKQTPGFSGADIANICNEAALIAARKNKEKVDRNDFLDAVDRIIGGLEKKNKIISKKEKEAIAYHEAGHATVSWLLEHASPLVKVTIVPRGQSLGAAWYLPEERQITTTEQIFDEMCAALGGRAAEEIVFGKISTGALSDLEKVTKQAYAMVSIYGMNKKIGNRSYYDSRGENQFTKPYSDDTAKIIDEEVSRIIETAYDRAKELLADNKDKLTLLAKKLLEKEVIFKDDLEEIFGKRKWKGSDEQEDSVSSDALRPDDKQVLRHKGEEEAEKSDNKESKDSDSEAKKSSSKSSDNGKSDGEGEDSEEEHSEASSDSSKN